MSIETATTTVVAAPTKAMTMEELYTKMDNANQLVDESVWCCIGSPEAVSDQKIFWEHWRWKDATEPLDANKQYKEACNPTWRLRSRMTQQWMIPFDHWHLTRNPSACIQQLIWSVQSLHRLGFPFHQSCFQLTILEPNFVRLVWGFGQKVVVHRQLGSCHVKGKWKQELWSAGKGFGIRREWFHMLAWDPEYKVGSAGEPDINLK